MRKVPVLTSLAAAFALFVAPAGAATLFGADPADVQLAPGETADDTFDLDDFFVSTSGTVSYTAEGANVDADGVADVMGLSDPGSTSAVFTATDGSETLEGTSNVWVSNFQLGNAPAVDNNNRIVGQDGGNSFVNLIVPGGSVSSNLPLTGLPSGGGGNGTPGGDTPNGVTGGAALIATIASVGVNVDEVSGFRTRTINGDVTVGADGSAEMTGVLTATLNADGNYSLDAGDNFDGAYIVSLGARSGASADVVQLLAASAQEIALTGDLIVPFPAGDNPEGSYADGAVTVGPGEGLLIISNDPVAVNGQATISVDFEATNVDGLTIASIGFDGGLAGGVESFANQQGANLEANVTKNISVSMTSVQDAVVPAFQVFNGGSAAATVTFSNWVVSSAGPVTDYTVNLNAKSDLGIDGSLASFDVVGILEPAGLFANINSDGGPDPAPSDANHFASASGSGSVAISGSGGVANASVLATLGQGTVTAEAYVQSDGGDEGVFGMVITALGQNSISAFKPASLLSADSWQKVSVSGSLSGTPDLSILTLQAAGFDAVVDDVAIRVVADSENHFDSDLLGGA